VNFKGLKTPEYINPVKATALFLEIDKNDAQSSSGFAKLKQIINRIVTECIKLDLVTK
jgi:hypothetical protein